MKRPTTRMAASKPISAAAHRRRLLKKLRAQSQAIGYGRFDPARAPELYELARAASSARGRTVRYQGVRFPLLFGWWKYVADPESGEALVATDGGLL